MTCMHSSTGFRITPVLEGERTLRTLQREREALIKRMKELAPLALERVGPEKRNRIYRTLSLEVVIAERQIKEISPAR